MAESNIIPSITGLAHELRLIERQLEGTLKRVRALAADVQTEHKDNGVLGSRGLTAFCIGLLRANTKPAWSVDELLIAAEKVGYAVPTRRNMSKRLTEYAYRRGMIAYSHQLSGWYWQKEYEVVANGNGIV